MKLTIYFDGQFWIGVVEMMENNKLKVCKYTFRSEPKDSEVLDFIFHDLIPLLNSTSGVKNSIDNKKKKTINPKRLIKLAAKEMKNQGVSNKSYQSHFAFLKPLLEYLIQGKYPVSQLFYNLQFHC
ncbi:YjdF family protein [Bacillus thuringiensis]|nr:YjdF family protein [Bacillus thuringiensis]